MSHGYNKNRAEKGGRFVGNGNCFINGPGQLRGWQLTCSLCGGLSKAMSIRSGGGLSPEWLTKRFVAQGWRIGNHPKDDVCARCQQQDRDDRLFADRERDKNRNRLANLHGMVNALDRFLTENIGVFSSPEFADEQAALISEFGSLLTTAFCLDVLPPQWKEEQPEPPPSEDELMKAYARGRADAVKEFEQAMPLDGRSLISHFRTASNRECAAFWQWLREQYAEAQAMHDPTPKPDERPTPRPPQPEPPRPTAHGFSTEASTSATAHLARMRAQLNGSGRHH
jgi:hypothetical protein